MASRRASWHQQPWLSPIRAAARRAISLAIETFRSRLPMIISTVTSSWSGCQQS